MKNAKKRPISVGISISFLKFAKGIRGISSSGRAQHWQC